MIHWSLLNEIYSFCILLILFIRYVVYERGTAKTARKSIFVKCLVFSMAFIALNILCVVLLNYTRNVPVWLNTSLNTLYFFSSIILCSLYAYLLFDAILEHVYDKHCITRAKVVLVSICAASTLLTILNIFTGWVFYIDEEGYHRGPINNSYYIFLGLELIFLVICYIRNRKSISDKTLYVIRTVPFIILIIIAIQILFPEVLLNGTIAAIASLIIFIAFRSSTEEYDPLTGAGSLSSFTAELELRSGSGQSVHIIETALLNISDINIRYNHALGDAVLYEVAHYLSHSIPHAQLYRTGGKTFTMLLPYTSDAEADESLKEIQRRLGDIWCLGETRCYLNIAVAEMRTSALEGSAAEIVERLEYTLDLAKKNGTTVRYDKTVKAQMDKHSSLIAYIREAIDERKFKVYYQPLYCCHKDIFCSAEALLRLSDGDGNPISPETFIPLAEENGMIEELTWMVLEDICALYNSGTVPELQYVSINLSMKQFLDPNLPDAILRCIETHGITPDKIKVEMTERFILHDADYARKQMNTLEAYGIDVYMDDFGTGYSNLSNVLQFPFSFIKLDRSLISPIAENKHAATMVGALIKLFGDMEKRIVAEGVETKEQAEMLKKLGIDMIQGFYYARPVPHEKLTYYFGK